MTHSPTSASTTEVKAVHIVDGQAEVAHRTYDVVTEDALVLDVEDVAQYTLMWTPDGPVGATIGFTPEDGVLGGADEGGQLALALGFAVSEGLVGALEDIKSLSSCPDEPGVMRLQLRDPNRVTAKREGRVVNSSCGICGPGEIVDGLVDDNALGLARAPETLQLKAADIPGLMARMLDGQGVFQRTGGCHGAAIFDASGNILHIAEDLGRHNALDKAIGAVMLRRGNLAGCGVLLSSRLSLEMVVKALRSELEIMLAVSAPTSLAIALAERFGLTLAGFVREQRATVYTHPQRILSHPAP